MAAFAATNRGRNGYDDDYEDEDDDDGDDYDDDDHGDDDEDGDNELSGVVDDDVDDDDDDEEEEETESLGDIAVINNAYDSRARLVNENTVGGTSPVGVGVRMEHLKDSHCDPVTKEPPSQGVEFLILDANGKPNRQVFELSQLIEYFRVHISTAEGQWRTKVKHPNQNIWCNHEEFLDYIKPVSEEVQTYLTNCRIRSGLKAVDHPLSLNQVKFMDRCRQGHRHGNRRGSNQRDNARGGGTRGEENRRRANESLESFVHQETNRRVRPRRDDARGRRTHGH
eukprot:scaffold15822_cov39-Cyclotella_meneghiniana.AAC.2